MIYTFRDLPIDAKFVGGKAYMLAMMTQQEIPVPNGIIISKEFTDEDIAYLVSLYKDKVFSLAVRSSAAGEDSKEFSFAGQNSSFLFVSTISELVDSIKKCFESINKNSSIAYRQKFKDSSDSSLMNVVIQDMIDPMYSGVYFSKDPQNISDSWVIEYIDGVGEDLVSGKRTPEKITIEKFNTTHISKEQIESLVSSCQKVEKSYDDNFDIEWAIDKSGVVHILQARPITTIRDIAKDHKIAKEQLKILNETYDKDTTWDGQTFSELTVCPSLFSFNLWAESFKKEASFDKALQKVGYLGFNPKHTNSILNNVFGRSYINLNELSKLYFGPMPYQIIPGPNSGLKFKLSKLNLEMILKTPYTIYRMVKASLVLNSNRKSMIESAKSDLLKFATKMNRPNDPKIYESWETTKLIERLEKESFVFSNHTLTWPYILISITETTTQTLKAYLKSIYGSEKSAQVLNSWSGSGIETETFEMMRYFNKACAYPEYRTLFLNKYGHRGPGELDLSSKRWCEMGNDAFYTITEDEYKKFKTDHSLIDVDAEISKIDSFKKTLIQDEWHILKELLELREKWKLNILKPFSHLRYILIELANRLEVPSDLVFWLSIEEIKNFNKDLIGVALERKSTSNALSYFNFSEVTNLFEINSVINSNQKAKESLKGEGISPGVVKGEVVIINNISEAANRKWPANAIIVAKSTDPGWTPLFLRAKGIIVERGGSLSHCAIVAREMGIPAVSGIQNCYINLKEGQHVWIDGNSGVITPVK